MHLAATLLHAACPLLPPTLQTASSATALTLERVASLIPPEVLPKVALPVPDLDAARTQWNKGVIYTRDLVADALKETTKE